MGDCPFPLRFEIRHTDSETLLGSMVGTTTCGAREFDLAFSSDWYF